MGIFVSIIIPSFNREELIVKTLDSIKKQTHSSWECIVVDDGSIDNTLEVVRAYNNEDNRFKLYKRPSGSIKGAPTCRNIGLNKAKGDFIIFLDSDDTLMPKCLENRINKIKDNNALDFLVFPTGIAKEDRVIKKDIPVKKNYLKEFLEYKLPWSIMCPIWKRDFILNLKGFKEGYPRLNDPELMIRALLVPDVNYKVFHNEPYDAVYYPNITDWTKLTDKYYKSLMLFIPDICAELELRNKSGLKKELIGYLKVWYRDFYFPSGKNLLKENKILLKMFYNKGVISIMKTMFLFTAYFFYLGFSYFKRAMVKRIITILKV